MKLYKLLFTFLLASCCWLAASAQCNMQVAATYTHSGYVYTFSAVQTGGTQPVQYAWQIDNTTFTGLTPNTSYQATLSAGTHTVCVIARDTTACYDSACYTIVVPAVNCTLGVSVTATGTPGSTGQMHAVVAQAHGQVHYLWSPTISSATSINVANAGNYCVTVTDSTGCTASACHNWQPCNMTTNLSTSHTPNNVYTFTATTSGGASPYRYGWYLNGNLQTPNTSVLTTTLAPGFYNLCVTDTDINGCGAYVCDTFTVHPINNCSLTASIRENYGIYLLALSSGAHGPVTYHWSNSSTSQYIYPSTSATYCVTITDSTGCTASSCFNYTPCHMQATLSHTHTGNTYIFTLNSTGGTAPHNYLWTVNNQYQTNHSNSLSITLAQGFYTLCAEDTDVNGCYAQACDTLTVPQPGGCTLAVSMTASGTPGSTGYMNAHVSGAHGPVTYHWSPGSSTSNILTVANAANYCVTVTDSLGCTATICHNWQPCNMTAILSSSHTSSNVYTFVSTTSGGSAPYAYYWYLNGNLQSSTSSILTSTLTPGFYTVCMRDTDINRCGTNVCDTFTVRPITNCAITGYVGQQSAGAGALLSAHVTGTHGPVTYHWNIGSSASQVTVTSSGTYCVTVSDSAGCSAVFCDTVHLCTMQAAYTYTNNPNNVYTFTGTQTGGVAPITWYWLIDGVYHGPYTVNTYSQALSAGTHSVVVQATDQYQCTDTSYRTVSVGGGCTLSGYIGQQSSGSVTSLSAQISNAHGNLTYLWNNGATTNSINVTTSNIYCVTVTDTAGCSVALCDTVHICNIQVAYTSSHNANNVYTFNAVQTGGAGAVTYYWTVDGSLHGPYTVGTYTQALSAGVHSVCAIVYDQYQCYDSVCQAITVPSGSCSLSGYISPQVTGSVAILTAHASGAHGPVTYHWNIGGTSNPVTVTSTGVYCVTITDSTGCTAVACDTVHLCNLQVNYTATHNSANQYIFYATQTGGTAPMTYYWNVDNHRYGPYTSPTYSVTLSPGTHIVCLDGYDQYQCNDSICKTITVGSNCTLYGYVTDTIIHNFFTLHRYTAIVYGGTPPYTYHWSTGNTTASFSTMYSTTAPSVTVTDANGCSVVLTSHNTTSPCTIHVNTTVQNSGTYAVVAATVSGAHGPVSYHWSNNASLGSVVSVQATGTYCVTVTDSLGCTATSCQAVTLNNNHDTICGTVFLDNNANGVMDGTEHGLASQQIYLYQGSTLVGIYYTNSLGQYRISVPLGTYKLVYTAPSGDAITIPLGSSTSNSTGIYQYIAVTQNNHSYCGYNFGVHDTNVTISGYVYFDANGNGVKDAGETGVANQLVHVGPHYAYTNANGYYVYVGAPDYYSITYLPGSPYTAYTATPSSHGVSATTAGTVYTGNDFGLHTSNTACNIATTIIPITTITAGRPAWYNVYVSNYGTNVASGTMTFYYDPVLTFNYSNPPQSSINAASHYVTFTYTGLLPGQYVSFTPYFTAATTVVPGLSTFELATATDNCNESNFYDNTDTLHQVATGSWDPNVKVVTPSGEGAQGLITRDQELRYTLNFQNTGNADAINIVLKDTLSALLDLSTIRIIGASHPDYAIELEGNVLTCRFSQIMLPDSNTDEKASHGYMSFAIKPLMSIADGSQIQNTASIYFDYNEAVVTNTTLNTIDYTLSVKDLDEHATITVMPNPFSESTTIQVTGTELHGAVLEVYNALGQVVSSAVPSSDNVFSLSRGSLSSGVYSYHIRQSGRTIGSGKLVVQ